jgi:hypothetical protein
MQITAPPERQVKAIASRKPMSTALPASRVVAFNVGMNPASPPSRVCLAAA